MKKNVVKPMFFAFKAFSAVQSCGRVYKASAQVGFRSEENVGSNVCGKTGRTDEVQLVGDVTEKGDN